MNETSIAYKLPDKFVKKYARKKPDFGFNGLGELTYMRTYSRIKEDGKNEKWYETIRRVVEGTYTMQKRHILSHGLGWDDVKADQSAQEMYERMFAMKFLPPGRGLWAMGTDITERGLFAALNNCAFVSTEDLAKDLSKPFEFLMDMSMLGVGVGFDVKGANTVKIQAPDGFIDYHIPDTREGWVDSVKALLLAYMTSSGLPRFDYQFIRPEGAPIKTFGGKASGPEPLKVLHTRIAKAFNNRQGQYITATDITDIMNWIGCCVVAGNVRRTAEIVFGPHDSDEYLDLKNYTVNPHRAEYGWSSNNSIFAELGMDYNSVAKRTADNGEPGYAWLENMQEFSRMCDPADNKDRRAKGGNPCLEQTLEPYELCCLVETFPTRCTDEFDYLRTLKFAYLYAKTVTLGNTHWMETNRVMLRNRRIGTSMSGIAQLVDNPLQGLHYLKTISTVGYNTIQYYDEVYSNWLCIPRSIKVTSIKPSGTVSLLPGVTPGMHWPESNFYIRRITIAKNSDLVDKCINAGYKVEDSVYDNSSVKVEIPVAISDVRTVSQVSMWEQFSLAAFLQKHWADNQVSCTVTFKPEEAQQIPHALNYFQYQLKGISLLPKTDVGAFQQMPYEEISQDTYDSLIAKITKIDFSGISEDSSPELYCDGDSCTIL